MSKNTRPGGSYVALGSRPSRSAYQRVARTRSSACCATWISGRLLDVTRGSLPDLTAVVHHGFMATREFRLSVAVPVGAREAIDHQVDMPRHLGVHPYLTDVRLNARGIEDGHEWAEYLVLEHPRFLGLRYPIRFPVRVVRLSPSSYVAHVSAAPGCTMRIEAEAV